MLRSCLTVAAEGCSGAWPAVTSTPVGGIFGVVCAALLGGQSTHSSCKSARCGQVSVGVLTGSPLKQENSLSVQLAATMR